MPVVPEGIVKILEEETPTGGRYGSECLHISAPPGLSNHDYTLPISISLLTARLDVKNVNDGDKIGFDVAPNTIIGALAEAVGSGVTTIPVPQSVIDLYDQGIIFDGLSLILDTDDCGIITGKAGAALLVKTGTTTTHAAAEYIKVTASMSPAIISEGWITLYSGGDKIYEFGEDKIGGSHIASGKVIRVRYNNLGQNNVNVPVVLSYLY